MSVTEIVVDVSSKGNAFLLGFGFGDGSGRIDRRQGKPRRFRDMLAAGDRAELWATMHQTMNQRYCPDQQREVKITYTAAFTQALKAEQQRLRAAKEVQS